MFSLIDLGTAARRHNAPAGCRARPEGVHSSTLSALLDTTLPRVGLCTQRRGPAGGRWYAHGAGVGSSEVVWCVR